MKKQEYLENLTNYREYACATNVHVPPTAGVNSGSHGRLFEQEIKFLLNNYRSATTIAPARLGYDTLKKLDSGYATIEIKSGSGTLASLDSKGNEYLSISNNDYVIYCRKYNPDKTILENKVYVLSGNQFVSLCKANGLTRKKKSTAMYKQPKELQYNDVLSLQSFIGNKGYVMDDILESYGIPLETWLVNNGLA